MDRREALMGLVAGASGGITRDFFPKKEQGKVLLVVYLYVGSLSPVKIEAFIERMKNKLSAEKPDNFNFLIIPDRHHSTWIDVFSLDGEPWVGGPHEEAEVWFKKILAEGKIRRIESKCYDGDETSDAKILEFCQMMFGAPVVPADHFPPTFEDDVLATIHLGRRYMVEDRKLQGFVYDVLRQKYDEEDFTLDE